MKLKFAGMDNGLYKFTQYDADDNIMAQYWLDDKHILQKVVWDKDKPTTFEKYYGVVVTEIVKRKLIQSCNIFIVTGRQRTFPDIFFP